MNDPQDEEEALSYDNTTEEIWFEEDVKMFNEDVDEDE